MVKLLDKNTLTVKYAVVQPVPDSYDHCVKTNVEKIDVAPCEDATCKYCKALQKLGLGLIWIKGDNTLSDSCFVET